MRKGKGRVEGNGKREGVVVMGKDEKIEEKMKVEESVIKRGGRGRERGRRREDRRLNDRR